MSENNLKKIIIFVGLMFLAAGCGKKIPLSPVNSDYTHQLKIGGQTLLVEIADTPEKKQQGLSGRNAMAQDQGMLFEFANGSNPAFWMKDMNFNLDFIWINNKKVVGITNNAPAPIENLKFDIGHLPLYYPPSPVDSVLEVNAGWSQRHNIMVGNSVNLN